MTSTRPGVHHTRRFKVLWTLWMGVGSVLIALAVYRSSQSLAWAIVALLASGPVLNAIGQVVSQPAQAVAASRRGHR